MGLTEFVRTTTLARRRRGRRLCHLRSGVFGFRYWKTEPLLDSSSDQVIVPQIDAPIRVALEREADVIALDEPQEKRGGQVRGNV